MRKYCYCLFFEAGANPVGAGLPAKQATRRMARASPVFAGKPAPTKITSDTNVRYGSIAACRVRQLST
ncbi:hypothetical protein DBB42_20550 [Pseudomonas plecoglossicida]|uniref:Uncharacterized protein n=1 Tax=Pseudomonas plecoglossicida TaxID=70775 RepID=A0A2R7UDX4_PSEDL|nr:hypothetical protein DBB42_20550 [Pseudomonas plecoglossicida]